MDLDENSDYYFDIPIKSPWNQTYNVLPPIQEEMNSNESVEEEPDYNDNLICWGCGEFGQHCQSTKDDIAFQDGLVWKFQGEYKDKVKAVSCGSSHTLVVTNSNEVYSWGNGNSGQLGKECVSSMSEAQRVELFETKTKDPPTLGVACGARHSMVWLQNGNVFSFGNNFYAQLGYNFREKNYKENQTRPYLLKFLVYRPVIQVACGEKHSVFRFQDGAIACVGCNAHGQIGMGNHSEAVVPKFLEMDQLITYVACGANHSMAITDEGEMYIWGYGKACGDKTNDILTPERQMTRKKNVIQVAGGAHHSMALTASGSVYMWGSGADGQLGFGDKVWFLSQPKRLVHNSLAKNIVFISCGDAYSAAVTENGELYMWGKNSHVIISGKSTSYKIWQPYCLNKGGQPVKSVFCGAWHAAAITGFPDLLSFTECDSGLSDFEQEEEIITTAAAPPTTTLMLKSVKMNGKSTKMEDDAHSSSSEESDIDAPEFHREATAFQREQTKLTLAEFYAPTPDIKKHYDNPSPSFYNEVDDVMEENQQMDNLDSDKPGSAKSTRLVVELPQQKNDNDQNLIDVGTSPIPFSSSASESDQAGSLVEGIKPKCVEHQTHNIPKHKNASKQRNEPQYQEETRHQNTYKMPIPASTYDRQKSVGNFQSPSFIQVSKTTADSFMLPRENTNLTKTQIDFKDVDQMRTSNYSSKPHEKISRIGKYHDSPIGRMIDINSYGKSHNDPSQRQLVYLESPFGSRVSDGSVQKVTDYAHTYGRIVDSPVIRTGRHSETAILNAMRHERGLDKTPSRMILRASESSLADYGRPQNTPELYEVDATNLKARLPPRPYHAPSMPKRNTELNFGLQITRNNTFVGPVKNSIKSSTNVNQFQRYANVHNPQASSTKNTDTKTKLGLITPRNVSIPHSRVPVVQEEADNLCVQGLTGGRNARFPIYSSATSWRDKSDMERVRAVSGNKSKSASPHSSRSGESPDFKKVNNGVSQDTSDFIGNQGLCENDGPLSARGELQGTRITTDSREKISLDKRHEKQNSSVSTFQLDSHIDLDSELTDLKIESSSKGFHIRKNGLFPASVSQTS